MTPLVLPRSLCAKAGYKRFGKAVLVWLPPIGLTKTMISARLRKPGSFGLWIERDDDLEWEVMWSLAWMTGEIHFAQLVKS